MDSFTIDEADALFNEPAPEAPPAPPPNPEDIAVPAGLTGDINAPNLASLAEQARRLQDALRISEAGRMAAMSQLQSLPQQPQQPQYQELSVSQLREMMASGDPDQQLAAVAAIQQRSLAQVEQAYRHKLDSLQEGSISAAEAEARRRYAVEFELFGDEILQRARSLPDRTPLTNPEGWRQIVSFVRGLDENFDRLTQRRARDAQAGNAGFSGAAANVRPASSAPIVVDETTRQIALSLGEDPVTYARLVRQWTEGTGQMTVS